MNILSNLNKQNSHVETIKGQLFDVINKPLFTNSEGFNPPNAFGIYKTTGGEPFGVLGKDFTPQQPTALFDSFVQCLVEDTNVNLTKIQYHEMKGGAKIRFSVPIKTMGFINLRGEEDENVISLNIQTGFDGYTSTSLYLSMYRMICANGMKISTTEFKTSFKNTIGNVGKIQLLCNDVVKAMDKTNNLLELIDKLDRVEITTKRKNEFIKKVLGYNLDDKDQLTTRKRNILQSIEDSIALEISLSGGNLWGLVNGITRYTNHGVKTFDASKMSRQEFSKIKDTYIYTETGEKTNAKALQVALEMAN